MQRRNLPKGIANRYKRGYVSNGENLSWGIVVGS